MDTTAVKQPPKAEWASGTAAMWGSCSPSPAGVELPVLWGSQRRLLELFGPDDTLVPRLDYLEVVVHRPAWL